MNKILQSLIYAFKYAFKNWRSDWGNFVILIIPVLIAVPVISRIATSSWIWSIIIILFLLVGWVQTNYHKDDIKQMKERLIRVEDERNHLRNDMESMPYEIIRRLFKYWGFGYKDRVTIYRYVEDGFIPVGRYSKNRELKKLGRSEYPKDVGFISESWQHGEFSIDDLPDYKKEKKKYLDEVSRKSGMKKGTLEKITMQSRAYFCKNLTNDKDNPIAVIVIESLNQTLPVESERLSTDLESFYGKVLVSAIQSNLPLGKGDISE